MSSRTIARPSILTTLLVLTALAVATRASATIITYDATNLSGSTWRYDYSVTNDTLGNPLNEFSIYFQLGQFSNVQSLGAPAGWDGLVAQPDPLLPDNGFIDLLAPESGLAAGQTLGGFSVVFDWLGLGAPGSQAFDIIDTADFSFIDSGFTVPAAVVTPPTGGSTSVPEPSTFALLALALPLAAIAISRRRPAARGRLAVAPPVLADAIPVPPSLRHFG